MSKKQREIDGFLVKQYRSGNAKALTELVKRWHRQFCEKAYWLVKDADAAKDVAQDSWKTIIVKMNKLQDPNSFGSWAMRIVYTNALDCISANNRKRKHLEQYKHQQDIVVEEKQTNESIKNELLKAIKNLVEHQQTVIKLFYVEDCSLKEISDILNISVGTAKSRLFHAWEKLKTVLKEKRNDY